MGNRADSLVNPSQLADPQSLLADVIARLSGENDSEHTRKVLEELTQGLATYHSVSSHLPQELCFQLTQTLISLSVRRAFTSSELDTERVRRLGGDSGLIWYPGLVIPESEGYAADLEINQKAVLCCLLELCKADLARVIMTSMGVRHAQALMFSLLNAVGGHRKRAWDIGALSAQLLTVLLRLYSDEDLDCQRKIRKWLEEGSIGLEGNLGAAIVSSLHSEAEFQVLCEALVEDVIEDQEEFLPLLLRFSTVNSQLHGYLCSHSRSLELLSQLLSRIWTEPKELHCELLNCLTASRQPGLLFCKPCAAKVPRGVLILFDLLAACTQKAIAAGQRTEGRLLAATFRNAGYFQKQISTVASHYLVAALRMTAEWPLEEELQRDTLRYLVELIAIRVDYYWSVRNT